MTFAWRRTACGMRHCFARRIVETGGRRELLRTSTRWVERQRVVEAEANRIAVLNAATPRAGSAIGKRRSSSSCSFAMEKPFSWGIKRGDILFCEREYPPLPAPLRVRRDYQFVLTNNFSHGMLTTTKGIEKEAFSFHPLKRGDGRCKSLRNGKGGAFEPRGGNAAPVPPLQGNEVPRIQRGIQVEPRTMICSP